MGILYLRWMVIASGLHKKIRVISNQRFKDAQTCLTKANQWGSRGGLASC